MVIEPIALAGHREVVVRDDIGRTSRHFVILCFASRWVSGEPQLNDELDEARCGFGRTNSVASTPPKGWLRLSPAHSRLQARSNSMRRLLRTFGIVAVMALVASGGFDRARGAETTPPMTPISTASRKSSAHCNICDRCVEPTRAIVGATR